MGQDESTVNAQGPLVRETSSCHCEHCQSHNPSHTPHLHRSSPPFADLIVYWALGTANYSSSICFSEGKHLTLDVVVHAYNLHSREEEAGG
jgi:hypothetical protein